MRDARYLAIDESNYGKWPEIHTCVGSNNPQDVEKNGTIPKRKKGISLTPEEQESSKHLIISREHFDAFGGERGLFCRLVRVVACVELIRQHPYAEAIIIDGEIHELLLEEMRRKIYKNHYHPKIEGIANADRHYPLVNRADTIARALFRRYRDMKNFSQATLAELISFHPSYNRTLVIPDLKNYDDVLKRLESK